MLFFIDTATSIRVYRSSGEGDWSKKDKIGIIPKRALELRPEPGVTLSEEEEGEIAAVLGNCRQVAIVQQHLDAARFPEIARTTIEFYISHASATERRLVEAALREADRAIQKFKLAANKP